MFKIWSYNAESLIQVDRLREILRLAGAEGVAICCLQSTLMSAERPWTCEGYRVIPAPRSSPTARDGCLTAVSLKYFAMCELRCVHQWLAGRLLGIRLRRPGPRPRDMYILNGYAYTNQFGYHVAAEADANALREAHYKSQDLFW